MLEECEDPMPAVYLHSYDTRDQPSLVAGTANFGFRIGGHIAHWIASLHLAQKPMGSIITCSHNFSNLMLPRFINRVLLGEWTEQSLIVDQTHPVLVSGKLVLQKDKRIEIQAQRYLQWPASGPSGSRSSWRWSWAASCRRGRASCRGSLRRAGSGSCRP